MYGNRQIALSGIVTADTTWVCHCVMWESSQAFLLSFLQYCGKCQGKVWEGKLGVWGWSVCLATPTCYPVKAVMLRRYLLYCRWSSANSSQSATVWYKSCKFVGACIVTEWRQCFALLTCWNSGSKRCLSEHGWPWWKRCTVLWCLLCSLQGGAVDAQTCQWRQAV